MLFRSAFIAEAEAPGGGRETLGTVRAGIDPDNDSAEFGVIVSSEIKGGGLGHILMDKLARELRANGTRRIVGSVLKENSRMRVLAKRLGFTESRSDDDPGLVHIELPLQPGV